MFATGLTVQTIAHQSTDKGIVGKVEPAIEDLGTSIRDLRTFILALQIQPNSQQLSKQETRVRILEAVSSVSRGLDFQPHVQFSGPIDSRVPEELINDVIAVVTEAVTNASKHANATVG